MERMEKKRSISEISATGNGSQVPVSNASGSFIMTDYDADGVPYDSTHSVKDKIDENATDIGTLSGYVADITDVIPSTATESNKLATQSDIPTVGTAAALDVAASGDASSTQVVKGDDSRLTDARNAADVYSWAKASTKPSYTASEVGAVATTAVGSANGVAELDSTGKVPSSQLPSYVDDVLEYDSTSLFPATGEDGKIYIAKDTNKTYRWSGTTYVEISESLALGETSSTAYAGNKGKANADAIVAIKDGTNIDSFSDVETALDGKANVTRQYIYGDTWSTKSWTGLGSFNGGRVWSDGTDIYYSNDSYQYVLDKSNSTWSEKTWYGLTSFRGDSIWTDGNNIYYSFGTGNHYVLNKSTSTWSAKTWSGFDTFYGSSIWTDGDNIYLSSGNNQYVLNKSTSTWSAKTWSGYTQVNGSYIWTDGTNMYYSFATSHYVLDKSTSTWSAKTWSGLTDFRGEYTWTDGTNTYYSSGSDQYILNKSTSTWSSKSWEGLTSFSGSDIWTDGTDIYHSIYSDQHVLSKDGIGDSIIEDSIIVKSNGDLQGAGEIYDNAGNALSEKFDANSFVLQKFRVTVSSSSWSSSQTSGYYTCALTLPYPINTYKEFSMGLTGSADGTDPTAAESAAYSLVNYFDANDGTGVTSATLRAKTKPTTTFYIMVSGYYMQKNAATSGVALDITTGTNLTIGNTGVGSSSVTFNGSTARTLKFIRQTVSFSSSGWSSTVNADGYYTNSDTLANVNTYCQPSISLTSISNPVPSSSEIAAYNLVDYFAMADGTAVGTVTAYAKTKPTASFYAVVKGVYFA